MLTIGAADRGLAAARLPDQSERLAPLQRERHVVHGANLAGASQEHAAEDREADDEILHVENGDRELSWQSSWYRWQRTRWSGVDLDERRFDVGARLEAVLAARHELAADRQADECRESFPGITVSAARLDAVHARNRPEQPLRVRMQRIAEQLARPAPLPESCRRT